MKNLTPELIAKAKAASTVDELLALAKENNVELTEEEAKTYFEQLNANGAVTDEELDVVTGGCGPTTEVTYKSGQIVELKRPCPTCKKCFLAVYHRGEPTGECFLSCVNCRAPLLFANTRDAIEKEYQGEARL